MYFNLSPERVNTGTNGKILVVLYILSLLVYIHLRLYHYIGQFMLDNAEGPVSFRGVAYPHKK